MDNENSLELKKMFSLLKTISDYGRVYQPL